ncbi:MAG: AraC family transcriptional regulator [Planctomycetota bacterium]|nr:AraC family transcriptional regulator [Planctomycetota bacterium]
MADGGPLIVRDVHRCGGYECAPPVTPIFRRLGIVETRRPYRYKPHQHLGYEVIFVDRGLYRCRLNDALLELYPDDVLIVKPGDWHADECEPPLRYFGIGFLLGGHGPGGEEARIFATSVRPEQQRFRADRGMLWPILQRIEREGEIGDPISSHVQDALLLELFWLMVRSLPPEAISESFLDLSRERAGCNALLRLFEAHATERLPVSAMARALHMSERLLARKCRHILGETPARAFLRFKLERARDLLARTEMSIKEISAYLGFRDQFHFSKAFKRAWGTAPSEYRRRY